MENKFQRLIGTPAWTDLNHIKENNKVDSDDEILQTIGHTAHPKGDQLLTGRLQYEKLKDLNRESCAEGPSITGISFHSGASVGLVTGTKGIVATIYPI